MAGSSVKCKTFISADEIEELKKKRQEEWEKVRKPDDPLEVPEEEYDPRSLYERLQEQKDKRQAEIEESHRLKNLIKGLDDDEIAFLELVDKTKVDMETKLWKEEVKEINEFNKAVANLSEKETEARLNEFRSSLKLHGNNPKKSQQDLLAASIKRKASNGTVPPAKKRHVDQNLETEASPNSPANEAQSSVASSCDDEISNPGKDLSSTAVQSAKSLQCLGVLPGLGAYSDSSDSENSSNSEPEKDCDYDLIGRKRLCIVHAHVQAQSQS